MYSSVHRVNDTFFVRVAFPGVSATKAFMHGRVSFDPLAKTVQFSRHPPVPFPDFEEAVKKDAVLSFALLAPDGTERPQRRDVLIHSKDGHLFSPGINRNPSKNSKEDGWRIRVLKFRAYFTHPGVETEQKMTADHIELPQWLQDSIHRQKRFRNRLVKLCLDARDACCPVNYEDFMHFVSETVLPAIENFNKAVPSSKDKISTKKLRVESPSVFVLIRFGAYLQHLESEGKPTPSGLAQRISCFTKDLKIDFTPINQFERNLASIMRRERYLEDVSVVEGMVESGEPIFQKVYRRLTDREEIRARRSELELRYWEWRQVAASFTSLLKQRRTLGLPFSAGWPRFSKETSTRWGIHFPVASGGQDASKLESKGIRGLKLDPPVPPSLSGRKWKPNGRRARRRLHPAQISFRDTAAGEQFTFRFAVLRHEFPIPPGSLIKEWKLIHNSTGLWLCLVVEGKFAKSLTKSGETGAVHIGWRRDGPELWPGLIFDPTREGREAFHRVIIDMELPPEKSDEHTPYRINMGPSRKGRRSPYWINATHPHLRAKPHATGAVQIQDTWTGIEWLAQWRDDRKDMFKSLLLSSLNPAPSGLRKAGLRTLHNIGAGLTDSTLTDAYRAWAAEDKEIADVIAEFSARVASRLSDGYSRVAHEICQLFSEHGVLTIAIQSSLLGKIAKKKKSSNKDVGLASALANSQVNRQRAAPGQLLLKLSRLAETYGLNVIKVGSADITRVHFYDDPKGKHLNPSSAERLITCAVCGEVYDQDENACRNMVANAIRSMSEGSIAE